MKKILYSTLAGVALSAALLLCACSSSESDEPKPTDFLDGDTQQTPILEPGTDARPNWVRPSSMDFEFSMSLSVSLPTELEPYVGEQDLMAVLVGDEVRAVTGPCIAKIEEDLLIFIDFPLVIFGNGDERDMALKYYCDKLHRIYTIERWADFDPSVAPAGEGQLYNPKFIK
jgi:hypothetical protein